MKTAIIFTGGTILSAEQSGYYSPADSRKNELLSLLPPDIEAEVFSPYIILSEQLNGEHLTALINEVDEALKADYDSILIIHGTDTLQYSAAAVSLAFGDAEIPIVFVSANYILDDERSNGRVNLHYAIEFMREHIGGVFVSYKNTGEKPSIYLGDTLLPHLSYSDNLYSTCGAFGYFEDDRFITILEKPKQKAIGKYSLSKASPIKYIKASPGMTTPKAVNCRAVLIETYHSGTLPTENKSLVEFCENCRKPIYIIGVTEGTKYSSTKAFNKLKLNILPPISPIMAYIVLWQKYSD